jgi:hypothetical protein
MGYPQVQGKVQKRPARPREGGRFSSPSSRFPEKLLKVFEFSKSIRELNPIFSVIFTSFEIRELPLDQGSLPPPIILYLRGIQ